MSKKQVDNESSFLQKPKAVTSGRLDPARSKTAPIEADFNIDVMENEESSEYIGSYNYYIYYHSIKPRDPRLPKPTYKPMPDMEFIKKGNRVEYDLTEQEEESTTQLGSQSKEKDYQQKIDDLGIEESGIDSMIGNLNLNDRSSGKYSDFRDNYFDYMQSPNYLSMRDYGNYSRDENFNIGANMNNSNMLRNKPRNFNGGQQPSGDFFYNQNQHEYYHQYGNNPMGQMNQMNQMGQMGQMGQMSQMSQMGPMGQMSQMGNVNMGYPNNLANNFPNNSGGYGMSINQNPSFQNMQGYMNVNHGMGPNISQGQSMNHMSMNFRNQNNFGGSNNFAQMSNFPQSQNNNFNYSGHNFNNNAFQNSNFPNSFSGKNNLFSNQRNFESDGFVPTSFNPQPPRENFNINLKEKQNFRGGNNMNNFGNFNTSFNPQGKKGFGLETPSYTDILSNILDLSRDHSGSRLVQKKYEDGSEEEKEKMFEKIFPEIYNLTKDVFGNYVIQKLLEFSPREKRQKIVNQLEGKIYELTMHMYGCRVIQKAIEVSEEDETALYLDELKYYIKMCIEDQNGNHVIQKLIEKLPKGEHKDILKVIFGRTYELSTHQYGCRVIQRIFEFCTEEEKEKILNEIYEKVILLCEDQYGNYVIQHIIEKMGPNKIQNIYRDLKGKIFDLSIHKFASNAIEKCLANGNNQQRKEIIEEIITKDDQTNDSLLGMVKDKYGNYVVQKMIEVADVKTKDNIIKRIISSQSLKKRDGFSKHVINFIEKMGFSANALTQNQWK